MKKSLLILTTLLLSATLNAQIRVLGIGNSFSEDALEQNLAEIARTENVPMIIANLYIGGCSIDRHVRNIEGDIADYRYTKFDLDGTKTIRKGVSLASVIGEEPWDYISVQQSSGVSGFYESYQRLPQLVEWLREMVPDAKIVFHQTWAYGVGSNHRDFPKYDCDQEKMYNAICQAVAQAVKDNNLDGIIPSGPALQILRQLSGNYDHTRDGYHLSKGMGRYTAACTWFAVLTGKNPQSIKYRPDGSDPRTEAITDQEAKLCRKAAKQAAKAFKKWNQHLR